MCNQIHSNTGDTQAAYLHDPSKPSQPSVEKVTQEFARWADSFLKNPNPLGTLGIYVQRYWREDWWSAIDSDPEREQKWRVALEAYQQTHGIDRFIILFLRLYVPSTSQSERLVIDARPSFNTSCALYDCEILRLMTDYVDLSEPRCANRAIQIAVLSNDLEKFRTYLTHYPDLSPSIPELLFDSLRNAQLSIARECLHRCPIFTEDQTASFFHVLLTLLNERINVYDTTEAAAYLGFFKELVFAGKMDGKHGWIPARHYVSWYPIHIAEKIMACRQNSPLHRDVCDLLLQRQEVTLPLHLLLEMQYHWRDYREILLARGALSHATLTLLETNPQNEEVLYTTALQQIVELQALWNAYAGSMDTATWAVLDSARSIKKQVKLQINGSSESSAMWSTVYQNLTTLYDRCVDRHSVFRLLRSVSQEFRKFAQGDAYSHAIFQCISLWDPHCPITNSQCKNRISSYQNSSREYRTNSFSMLRDTLVRAFRSYDRPYWTRHSVTWLHGTKSAALPGIMEKGGLYPTGLLLRDRQVVPLCGELCGSDRNINATQLSGERLSATFENPKGFYYDANSRWLITWLYASSDLNLNRDGRPLLVQPEQLWQQIQENLSLTTMLTSWKNLRFDFMRFRRLDPDADTKLLALRNEVQTKLHCSGQMSSKEQLKLQEIDQVLNEPCTRWTEAQCKWIQDPFPIVFASTTLSSTPFPPTPTPIPREYLVEGAALLGSDLQIAFTLSDRVATLQALFDPKQLRVLPMEQASLLETLSMQKGSERALRDIIYPLNGSITFLQQRLAEELEYEILPAYSRPLPPEPRYLQQGQEILVPAPFFGHTYPTHGNYMHALQLGQIVPRTVHGRLHALRITIAGQILSYLYQAKPLVLEEAMAIAAHDWQRQDEGQDLWDEESAHELHRLLLARGVAVDLAETCRFAMAHKDTHPLQNPLQIILHDADVLEIHRVLPDSSLFRVQELHGCAHAQIPLIVKEWREWVCLTESEGFKQFLEQHSTNNYRDLMGLLRHEVLINGRFPIIGALLAQELTVFPACDFSSFKLQSL